MVQRRVGSAPVVVVFVYQSDERSVEDVARSRQTLTQVVACDVEEDGAFLGCVAEVTHSLVLPGLVVRAIAIGGESVAEHGRRKAVGGAARREFALAAVERTEGSFY